MIDYKEIITAIKQHLNETLYLSNALTNIEFQEYIDNLYEKSDNMTINFKYELNYLKFIADKYTYDVNEDTDTDCTFSLQIESNKIVEPLKASTTAKFIYDTKYSISKQPIHNENDLYNNLRKDYVLVSGAWKNFQEQDNYHGAFIYDIYNEDFLNKLEEESIERIKANKRSVIRIHSDIEEKDDCKIVIFSIIFK